jgi:MFS family permease
MAAPTDRLLLLNAMLGQFISGFAARMFAVSLPTIAGALHADILGIAWAIMAYQLAGISLSVVFGRLGDVRGRHRIYGVGFAIMAASSLLCGLSPSAPWLIAGRFVQGIGAAMLASATRVLAMEAMPESAAGKANGFMTMSFHGGVLLGPPLGGAIIDLVGWRWTFFLLVPIGLTGAALTALKARGDRPGRSAPVPAIDYGGAALLVALTVVLTLLLDRRSADAVGLGHPGALALLFAAALGGFLAHERRARAPVVNFALFRIRMFSFSVLSLLAVATGNAVLTFVLPFYMQEVLHQSPSLMGLIFLSAPVFTVALAAGAGQLTDRVGPRIPASIGVLLSAGAFVVGALLRADSPWLVPAVVMAFMGLGQAFFNTPNQTAIITSVPREYRGFATGMVQMVFGLGSLLGISLAGVLLTAAFRHATGLPDATPSPAHPGPFVAAMNATFAACAVLMGGALVASLMRGGRAAPAAAPP